VLTVEDGTGVPNANCYISLSDCDAYHSERSNAGWTGANSVKEAAIIRAADYLEWAYDWRGSKLSDDQPMQFPRTVADLPAVLVKANAELALLALSGDLMPPQEGGKVQSESVEVAGAVKRARTYVSGGYPAERRFPFVDKMLAAYAIGPASGVKAVKIERA
jgi:hypothetical protein